MTTPAGLLAQSDLWRRAQAVIPGGVNSPVRAMRSVGVDEPFFVSRGDGAYLETTDGLRLLDWVQSWGPLIFGHADPETVEAVRDAALAGMTFGAPTEREVELAAEIADAVPSIERVRLVSSGTEAAMSALRLARGFTARTRVLKFAGGYHGHADAFLAEAGSGLATLGIPASPGVPTSVVEDTVVVDYNEIDQAAAAVERHAEDLAAVFVEPVAGNMGCVPPAPGLPRGAAGALRRLGRAARLRRGDHGLQGRARRRTGAVRRAAGPDRARQDRRRRPAACGFRRARRRDGAARAGRRRVPGRDAVGQPAGDGGRAVGAPPAPRRGRSTTSSSGAPPASRRGSRVSGGCSASAPC